MGSCLVAASMMLPAPQAAMADVVLSGWINEGITYYDDGVGSDAGQLSDNGTTLGSRITLSGSHEPEGTKLKAGFEVIVEPFSGTPNFAGGGQTTPLIFANQNTLQDDFFNGGDIGLLGSSLYVGGKWGKITIGLQSMPTDNIAVLADPSGTIWSGISPVFRGNGFFIRGIGAGASNTVWGSFLNCLTTNGLTGAGGIGIDCNGVYRNGVRYDLPAFGPVSVAIGGANDDIYDIAAKYNGQIGPLKTIVHVGYASNNDGGAVVNAVDGSDILQFQIGLMHDTTGLFGTLAFQKEEADGAPVGTGDDTDAYHIKAGIKRNWWGIGDTAVYGEYGSYNDQYGAGNSDGITGSEVQRVGVVLDQHIGEKLIVYGKYEQLSLDVEGNATAQALYNGAEDLKLGTVGVTYFF